MNETSVNFQFLTQPWFIVTNEVFENIKICTKAFAWVLLEKFLTGRLEIWKVYAFV